METTEWQKINPVRGPQGKPAGRKANRGKFCSRKEEPLAQKQVSVDKWLARKRGDMIVCPNQPGQLTISKSSCSKRYIMSRRENLKELLKGDFFQYIYMRGLSVCRDCPIGKKLSVGRSAARPRPAARP
jgi:hypothetical protein